MSEKKEEIAVPIGSLYESREKIYPREMSGRYQTVRNYGLIALLAVFYILPWISWNGRQAILFYMVERRFYILDLVIWPQDLIILSIILLIMALTLFFVTTLAGRVWCGYACPQTIWTEAFIWIERFCEGSRAQQIKLDKAKWDATKIRKKVSKHGLWILLSLYTGLTFVGYFTPIRQLIPDFVTFSASFAASFWAIFYAGVTYMNAGWLREQVCKYMCPYARFQGAMYDEHTLLITYDRIRGEPRRKATGGKNPEGHCIDCSMCVQVCPTGIDIRDGNQPECIGCALCIDACDEIMDKTGAPRGLIRYASEASINHKKTKIIRPKSIGYGILLIVGYTILTSMIINIKPIELNVIRDRNVLSRQLMDGRIENSYRINILNKSLEEATYTIYTEGVDNMAVQIEGQEVPLVVGPGKVYDATMSLIADKDALKSVNMAINVVIENVNSGEKTSVETRFLDVR